jgi:alpha-D-ribose 1-methylphosphonate 5-triphosphate synthase subunit PhnL
VTETPHLSVRGLDKQFVLHLLDGKRLTGFSDISFDVPAGRFVGIAGRSGSGKSSLLKCVYRTYLADAGAMLFRRAGGTTVDLAAADDDTMLELRGTEIGYVSQFLRPTPRVRALDLAARPLLRRGVALTEARERVAELFERLSLPRELWDGYPILFSGGEQQRVNLTRALVAEPRLLLLDEPTSALDASLQDRVVELLAEAGGRGTTMIGVMHDTALLAELADEVITMADGRIVNRSPRTSGVGSSAAGRA